MITLLWVLAYLLVGVGVMLVDPTNTMTSEYYLSSDDDLIVLMVVAFWPIVLIVFIMGGLGGILSWFRFRFRKWLRGRNRK